MEIIIDPLDLTVKNVVILYFEINKTKNKLFI